MTEKLPMTAQGYQRLLLELEHLKQVESPENIKAIAQARAHGDLSENGEYQAAREQQGHIEGRVKTLEHVLGRAEIIDVSRFTDDVIRFGARVTVVDTSDQNHLPLSYQIVGQEESDITQQRLSISSPLARALVGQSVGKIVEVTTPRGRRCYQIISVSYS